MAMARMSTYCNIKLFGNKYPRMNGQYSEAHPSDAVVEVLTRNRVQRFLQTPTGLSFLDDTCPNPNPPILIFTVPLTILAYPPLCARHVDRMLCSRGVAPPLFPCLTHRIVLFLLDMASAPAPPIDFRLCLRVESEIVTQTLLPSPQMRPGTEIRRNLAEDPTALRNAVLLNRMRTRGPETEAESSAEGLMRTERFDGDEEDASCAVCLDDVSAGTLVARLPCSHFFHTACIAKWFERVKNCPLCRRRFD